MPDPSSTPASAMPGNDSGKKNTTQVIAIQPTESRPKHAPIPPPGIQPRPPPEHKSQTMRISLADVMPAASKPADSKQTTMSITEFMSAAPKPADSKQTTMPITEFMSAATPMPPTIQLKRPPSYHGAATAMPETPPITTKSKTGPLDSSTVTHPAAAEGKKGTTRLILDAGQDAPSATEVKRSTSPITVIPQTIRLKRAGGPTFSPPSAKARTDALSAAPTIGRMPDLSQAKMVTARILVEETAPAHEPPAEAKRSTSLLGAAAPRTIRLKKPSDSDLEEAAGAGPDLETPTVRKVLKKDTSKISLPTATEPAPITQRQTIKIKRTEHNAEPRTVKMKLAAATAAPTPDLPQTGETVSEDDPPSPLFFSIAAAAAVVIACLVYIMAAQAFGPELLLPVPASLL